MVMRTCTGQGAREANGEVKAKEGGPSQNNREIAKYISSEDQMMRLAALDKISNPKALAYVAATADHKDVKEAARERLFKDISALLGILNGIAGSPEPWERELIHVVKEGLVGSSSKEAKVVDIKIWQLENSKGFGSFVRCKGEKGITVEYIDESPVQFNPDALAQILEAA